jgi:gliding motility-associated-like protein
VKQLIKISLVLNLFILAWLGSNAQLQVTPESTAMALVQKLLGGGVTVSNVSLVADPLATGFFNNISGTFLGIDSGIVMSTGRVKSVRPTDWGVDGDGTVTAQNADATTEFGLPGDPDLAASIGVPVGDTRDAAILEFDFVPVGDTIRFNYVFSSEEYTPAFVCDFNDAFAFFITGPGFPVPVNIALVPNTLLPVSIFNVNDVPGGGCPNNTMYYIDNRVNTFFTHDGHTRVFTAWAKVVPCQTYHLKLVIADVIDEQFDSGVFLEAKSLSSNAVELNNLTQTDRLGNSYLVEGCSSGRFQIKRPNLAATPLTVNLSYGGTAINGTDVQALPSSVTIPANDTVVFVDVIPVVDGAPEGIETLIIYALAGCAAAPSDSAIIQIRDYDTLGITPRDTSFICKGSPVQLTASAGYTSYNWDPDPTLSSTNIPNPIAIPVSDFKSYYCTATEGNCNARDSIMLRWKRLYNTATQGVNCKDGSTGEIRLSSGQGWIAPIEFSINNGPYQGDSTFSNLPAGTHRVKIKDGTGCTDSLDITVVQLFPTLLISNLSTTAASCSGAADGTVTITASGGLAPYEYSVDGVNYQPGNTINIAGGNRSIWVRDNNNCVTTQTTFIPLNNSVTVDAGMDGTICEGKTQQLNSTSNGTSVAWTPSATLSNATILNPVASPTVTTKYFVTATTGICSRTDSVTVFVDPAPIPNAGVDVTVCYAQDHQLNGSGGIAFTWTPATNLDDPAIFNPTISKPTSTVIYSLAVVDAKGCSSLKDDSITISVTTPAVLFVGNDTVVAMRQPVQLTSQDINNFGFTTYTWSPALGLNSPFIANPVAILNNDITYHVYASTAAGCEAFDTINIKVYEGPELYVPNAFTPNGDGLNDVLRVVSIGMKEFHFFRIYNRYGELVFSTTDPAKGWDGTLKGKKQSIGTYVWMTEAIDYRGNLIQRTGTTLIIQ